MAPDELVGRLRAVLADAPGDLLAVYLFGSEAREQARPESDVDLAFLYRDRPPKSLDSPHERLVNRIERGLGRPVDAVVLNGAPPDLSVRVLRDGVLVLDRDRPARIRFEVRARSELWDLQPILDLYRGAGRPSR